MAGKRPQWQLQVLVAQKRDKELRRIEQQQKVANYFETNTLASRHHEQWTTKGYYEKANKEAELLSERKLRAAKLEERRKKLELMLFQENMQFEQELKTLSKQPKLFKNGSYLNDVPTSTLRDINEGIRAKEDALRRQEAELRLYHAWRTSQPEIRAAESYMKHGKLKSAWMEQIVQKEVQKKKEEEETRKHLEERDESIRKQIQIEEEKMKTKELQIKDLRNSLEGQIAELNGKETVVEELRRKEERQNMILEELKLIREEREREHKRLAAERDTSIVNMGLFKYKLKKKVLVVMKEIELDLDMMDRLRGAALKEELERDSKCEYQRRILDAGFQQLMEHRERETQRQKNIEAMYDGEARQINDKQDKLWAKEREARAALIEEVLRALRKQVEEKIEANRRQQRENVLEREQILDQVDSFHQEVKDKEKQKQLQKSSYGTITSLQSELNGLALERRRLEERAAREAEARSAAAAERRVRAELARTQRAGAGVAGPAR